MVFIHRVDCMYNLMCSLHIQLSQHTQTITVHTDYHSTHRLSQYTQTITVHTDYHSTHRLSRHTDYHSTHRLSQYTQTITVHTDYHSTHRLSQYTQNITVHTEYHGTFYFADCPSRRGPLQKTGAMISTLKCRLLDTQHAKNIAAQ